MSSFVPSPQQAAIFAAIDDPNGGNLNIVAVAGAGKTTTLVQGMARMKGQVAFAAYNKAIATEISARLAELGSSHAAKTFHAFGLSAWMKVARPKIEEKKTFQICERLKLAEQIVPFVRKAVSLGKQMGAGFLFPMDSVETWFDMAAHHDLEDDIPEGYTLEQLISISIQVLGVSVSMDKEIIDFDDMIFAPLIHNAPVAKFDWVLIDEAQDTNPVRRAFAKKMLRTGGRMVAVGDPRQAIYGFTGADANAMDIIAAEFNSKEMPLTVTYRCPKEVVRVAQTWVSHIEAHPTAPLGSFSELTLREFRRTVVGKEDMSADAILCRNTKPLVELAYDLIRSNVACHVEGRDIGRGLIALINRLGRVKGRGSVEVMVTALEDYCERQVSTLMAKGKEVMAAALQDKVETIIVIANQLPVTAKVGDLIAKINSLFDDSNGATRRLTLSTIHKAKGREWNRVWWLGRDRFQPSPFARQSWQQDQEVNLMYVAATRAKSALVDLIVPQKGEAV